MLDFQVACAQKLQTKNDFFCAASKYGMLLLNCKNFRKNATRDPRISSTLHFALFKNA